MRARAVLFDLFGTVVHFHAHVPTVEVAGTPWRSTMNWLRETAERELPEVRFDALLPMLMQVTEEMVRERAPEYVEVPSRERFRRALSRLGVDAARAPSIAERLSLAHMGHLASMTVLPPAHVPVLQQLAARYRLGVVSNFDHAPTAHRILVDHAVAHLFDPILISDTFGRRKPHAAIFEAALAHMQVSAADAIFVGDSVSDDVVGAHNTGLRVVWVNTKGVPFPSDAPTPTHVIMQLTELPALLSASS